METMEGWKSNTDFTRTDSSKPGKKPSKVAKAFRGKSPMLTAKAMCPWKPP
jgi:hypothetical protein